MAVIIVIIAIRVWTSIINNDFSPAVSDFKAEDVAARFKTDGHVLYEIVVEK